EAVDRRKTREIPIKLDVRQREGAGDKRIGRRIRDESKIGRARSSQIELRFINSIRRANGITPVQQRRRNRQCAHATNLNMPMIGERFGAEKSCMVRPRATEKIGEGNYGPGLAPPGAGYSESPAVHHRQENDSRQNETYQGCYPQAEGVTRRFC